MSLLPVSDGRQALPSWLLRQLQGAAVKSLNNQWCHTGCSGGLEILYRHHVQITQGRKYPPDTQKCRISACNVTDATASHLVQVQKDATWDAHKRTIWHNANTGALGPPFRTVQNGTFRGTHGSMVPSGYPREHGTFRVPTGAWYGRVRC
jgi:hypothetical protein